ncbi:hypothetical protein MUP77_10645 [Candidatus Bathyarchaeota archaeon]|nr:hypothetical protein [Candidatus Bathyarchaeota archaeon]
MNQPCPSMGRITVSSHTIFYNTIEELQKNLRFKNPEYQRMLGLLLKWASRERGAWTNSNFYDPKRFIILNGLVYTYLLLDRLEKRLEALEDEARELGIVLEGPERLEEASPRPELTVLPSTQEDYVSPSFEQIGLDRIIFQTRS